jgi:hypothetical protein
MEHCWAAEPSERTSTKALLECISLMIADRQHSLGLPVRSNLDAVDREFVRQHSSSDGSANKVVMQQLAQLQQQQQQQDPHRQPTPARMPHHHQQHHQQQQTSAYRVMSSPVHVARQQQQQQHSQDALGQYALVHSLQSSGHESSGQHLTHSSHGSGPGSVKACQDQCAVVYINPAAAGMVGVSGGKRSGGGGGVCGAKAEEQEHEGFLRDL